MEGKVTIATALDPPDDLAGTEEELTMMTTISVSAQFGGLDAGEVGLPHFRALKSALKGRSFEGFPFPELAFILRVDGQISTYDLSGAGYVELDKKRRYVSVDIGVARSDWMGRGPSEVAVFIAGAIMATVDLFKGRVDDRLRATDWAALETALQAVCAAYLSDPHLSVA